MRKKIPSETKVFKIKGKKYADGRIALNFGNHNKLFIHPNGTYEFHCNNGDVITHAGDKNEVERRDGTVVILNNDAPDVVISKPDGNELCISPKTSNIKIIEKNNAKVDNDLILVPVKFLDSDEVEPDFQMALSREDIQHIIVPSDDLKQKKIRVYHASEEHQPPTDRNKLH